MFFVNAYRISKWFPLFLCRVEKKSAYIFNVLISHVPVLPQEGDLCDKCPTFAKLFFATPPFSDKNFQERLFIQGTLERLLSLLCSSYFFSFPAASFFFGKGVLIRQFQVYGELFVPICWWPVQNFFSRFFLDCSGAKIRAFLKKKAAQLSIRCEKKRQEENNT